MVASLFALLALASCGPTIHSPTIDDVLNRNADLKPDRSVDRDELVGEASWYGGSYNGRATANGETFDMGEFTAAHRTLPFNTVVRVVDKKTLKTVVVRINDRGPFGKRHRIIDLSRAAANDLNMIRRGKAQVVLEILVWGDGQTFHHARR